MKLTDCLANILRYYGEARGAGHTSLMKRGTNHSPQALIVVVSQEHARTIQVSQHTLPLFNDVTWRGVHAPIAWDNFTIEALVRECLATIYALEDTNKCSQEKIETLDSIIINLELEILSLGTNKCFWPWIWGQVKQLWPWK